MKFYHDNKGEHKLLHWNMWIFVSFSQNLWKWYKKANIKSCVFKGGARSMETAGGKDREMTQYGLQFAVTSNTVAMWKWTFANRIPWVSIPRHILIFDPTFKVTEIKFSNIYLVEDIKYRLLYVIPCYWLSFVLVTTWFRSPEHILQQ